LRNKLLMAALTRPTIDQEPLMTKLSLGLALALALGTSLAACGEQGYGPTHSYSARYDSGGTAADAAANNGSVSSSVVTQRRKESTYYGY
jgi:hypothetical protein